MTGERRRARVLLSYHYFKRADLASILGEPGDVEVMADSGAFSAYHSGAVIERRDYVAWLRDWAGYFTCAANLDVIGDYAAGVRNLEWIGRQDTGGVPILPVFHPNEPWELLDSFCREFPYVALGGIAGPQTDLRKPRMAWGVKGMQIAAEHGTAIHALGVTSPLVCNNMPFYSVDSSSVAFGQRFGVVYLWDEAGRRIEDCFIRNAKDVRDCADLLKAHGLRPHRINAPGFGRVRGPGSDRVQGARDLADLMIASTRCYSRFGRHFERKHAVPAPAGQSGTGTKCFIACGTTTHVGHVLDGFRAEGAGTGAVRKPKTPTPIPTGGGAK